MAKFILAKHKKENMIYHIIGNAMEPIVLPAYICHIVNNKGLWGAGFVLAISKISKKPEEAYRKLQYSNINENKRYPLGKIQIVPISKDISVCNMIAQNGIRSRTNTIPLNYRALANCLDKIHKKAKKTNYTIHMPRIGAGLAGGDWDSIENIIKRFVKVDNYIYTLENEINKFPKVEYKGTIK